MFKRLREKLRKAKQEDKAAYQSMVISTILHATIAGSLLYVGAEKIINEMDLVEFSIIGDSLDVPKEELKSNGISDTVNRIAQEADPVKEDEAPEVGKKPQRKKSSDQTKRPESRKEKFKRISKKPTRKAKKVAKGKGKGVDKSIPSDPELRKIYLAEKQLKDQEALFKKQLVAKQKDAKRQKEIEKAKRRLALKQEAFRLRQSNVLKQQQVRNQMEQTQKKLVMQKEKLKLQKIAQKEYEQTRRQLLNKQRALLAEESQLKSEQTRIHNQVATNNALAERQQKLALRQEAMRQNLTQDRAFAKQQASLEAKRRQVEAAEARARLKANGRARAIAKRKSMQAQEAALRIREGRARQQEHKYGVNLPDGARSMADLRQRPGNRRITYPDQAKRNGWQGDGLVLYFVTNNGTVKNVQMVRTTGYPALDEAAVNTFRTYRFYPGQSGWTYNPVIFKLRERSGRQTAELQ